MFILNYDCKHVIPVIEFSLELKITARFAETSKNTQHTTLLSPESRSHTITISSGKI
jgi:hypothetical protein